MYQSRSPSSVGLCLPIYPVLALALLLACSGESASSSAPEPSPAVLPAPGTITVEALASALQAGTSAAFDANTAAVRIRHGQIPQATLLSHFEEYQLSELPGDRQRPLVFYCVNTYCSSSDAAARRAIAAGYRDVRVLRAGIRGWAKAGQPTRPVE